MYDMWCKPCMTCGNASQIESYCITCYPIFRNTIRDDKIWNGNQWKTICKFIDCNKEMRRNGYCWAHNTQMTE